MRTLLLASAFLTATGFAQDPGQSPPSEVRAAPAGVQQWIRQLGSDSYRERLDAENKLRAQGTAAKEALERAAADERDSEVQWRAKRLLRQLERDRAGTGGTEPDATEPGLVERRPNAGARREGQDPEAFRRRASGSVDDVRSEFDRLFRQLEKQHGIDVPRFRFFDDKFFDDIRSQFDSRSNSHGTSVQVTPEGVRVEVTETGEDGTSNTSVYEAPDMETFHKKHPGILGKGGNGLGLKGIGRAGDLLEGLRAETNKPSRGFEWKLLKPQVLRFNQGLRSPVVGKQQSNGAVPKNGSRLGVAIDDIPDVLRDYLELDRDTGLMVASVQQGTLAASLRLQPGDIVVSINGDKIASAADVQKALSAIKKGADVDVAFIRRGERREASTKKQYSAQPEREALPPKQQSTGESVR